MNAYRCAPLRHIAPVPPPIQSGRTLYWFHPELTVGFCGADGEVRPLAAPRLVDVLAVCPHQAVITRRRRTAIIALWKVPDIPPPWVESDEPPLVPPIPDFVVRDACAAVEIGRAFLVFGRRQVVLHEVVALICGRLAGGNSGSWLNDGSTSAGSPTATKGVAHG